MADFVNPFMDNNAGNNMFWDQQGGGFDLSKPIEDTTGKKELSELLEIVGYIAGRKNTLSDSFDNDRANKEYKEAFLQAAKGSTTAKEVNFNGEIIKSSFSQASYKKLLGEEKFNELQNDNFYKLNVKEGNPEYLVCSTTIVKDADPEVSRLITKKISASSPKSETIIIKPKALADLLYGTNSKGNIYIKVKGVEAGVFVPQKLNRVNKKGEHVIALRFFPKNENGLYNKYVPQLGCIKGIPYAVNKSFEGEPIQGEIKLSNEKQIQERYPELLDKLHTIGKTMMREEPKGTDQTIPYEVYQDEYQEMGVTPHMLEKLRSKKTSDKEFTLIELTKGFLGEA